MTPADIAAVTGNNDGFGGNNGWWIIILLLAFGRGFGFGGYGGGGGGAPCATQADVRSAVDQQTLISKLDQQTYGLADVFNSLNNTINGNFRTLDNAICTLGYQNQQGFADTRFAMKDCCCETQRLIERGFCDTNNTIHNSSRDIIDNANANSRAILDFLTREKIDSLRAENDSLRLAASQAKQNQYLINELRPCPVPAYITCNPFAGVANNGCGCNGF
jgi:hypothetical protein